MILAMATIILGTVAFGSLTMGYFLCPTTIIEWCIYALATALLFFPGLLSGWTPVPKIGADLIGIGLWALVYLMQKARIKRNPNLLLPDKKHTAHMEAHA